MAERNTAVHAAPSLLLQLAVAEFGVDLVPVLDPDVHRAAARCLAPGRHEPLGISHDATPSQPCAAAMTRSEEHTSELQSLAYLVCRLLLEKKKQIDNSHLKNKKNKQKQDNHNQR